MIDGSMLPFAERELAKRSLLDYCKRVYRGFEAPPHIVHIAELLERVARGELRRLIINVPARHGKSTISSMCFPAWYLGRNPERNIICASHSEDLAVRNSRLAKSLFEDQRSPFDAKISKDSSSAQRWNTEAGGGLFAIGTGGGITGRGGDVILIDDPLHDGLSETECERAWNWFREILAPRLEPGGSIVLLGTRFREDDLFGRALEAEDGESWTVVRFPAIAEGDDVLGRQAGEALWPERMPFDELELRRVSMGSRAFESQFQQNPTPACGAFFKLDWFDNRYDGGLPRRKMTIPIGAELAPGVYREVATADAPCHVLMAVDCASKTGISNDYSVLATIATDEVDFFIVDIVRERLEFTDLVRRIIDVHAKYGHARIFIEDASAGIAVTQELRRWTRLPVIPRTPQTSKIARAESITGFFESKRVRVPEHAPWLEDFFREFLSFPSGRHDDIVDAVVLGITTAEEMVVALENDRRNDGVLASHGYGSHFL